MKVTWTSTRLSLLAAGTALALSAVSAQQSQPGAQRQQPPAQTESQQNRRENAQTEQRGVQQQTQQQGVQQSRQSAQPAGQGAGSLDRLTEQHENLSTFVRALEVTGLADDLTGDTQYTVFAPTDEAFRSVNRDVDELLAPENRDQLVAMLRAHIVADDVAPETARRINEALTLDGETITLEERNGTLMVGDASVVESNIQQGNLRIYAIDEVLDRGERQVATTEQGRPEG